MISFNHLPLLVHEQIITYAISQYGIGMNQKVGLLGVCHDWRQIASRQIYHTIRIYDPAAYPNALLDTWLHSEICGHRWYLNITPYNIGTFFLYAKKLHVIVGSSSGLKKLSRLLKHIFQHGFSEQAAICNVEILISQFRIKDYAKIFRRFQRIADILVKFIPRIDNLFLDATHNLDTFTSFFSHILTAYSGPSLRSLKLSRYVGFGGSIDLQNLTALDIGLSDNYYRILSFVEPRILRKLSFHESYHDYIWSYFSLNDHDDLLAFSELCDLRIRSGNNFDGPSNRVLGGGFSAQHKQLNDKWQSEILGRTIDLPKLKMLECRNCNFSDLVFASCRFPTTVAEVSIYHQEPVGISACEWVLDNIPARWTSIATDRRYHDEPNRFGEKILCSRSGGKITVLRLDKAHSFDATLVRLSNLRSLHIRQIFLPRLVSVISRLDNLQQLSICDIDIKDPDDEATYNPDDAAPPICLSLVKLIVRQTDRLQFDELHSYIQCLLRSLTSLRLVYIDAKQGGRIASYIANNQYEYSHFRTLDVVMLGNLR